MNPWCRSSFNLEEGICWGGFFLLTPLQRFLHNSAYTPFITDQTLKLWSEWTFLRIENLKFFQPFFPTFPNHQTGGVPLVGYKLQTLGFGRDSLEHKFGGITPQGHDDCEGSCASNNKFRGVCLFGDGVKCDLDEEFDCSPRLAWGFFQIQQLTNIIAKN